MRAFWLELVRKGVGFDVLRTWSVWEGEFKTIKEECPFSLTRIQPLGRTDVLQIFVICPDHKWLLRPLQPGSSFLQASPSAVPYVVIPLRWRQLPGEEGTRVNLLILRRLLGKNCPHTGVWGIHLHNKLVRRVREYENGSRGDTWFQLTKSSLCRGGPPEGHLQGCEGGERSCLWAVVSDVDVR